MNYYQEKLRCKDWNFIVTQPYRWPAINKRPMLIFQCTRAINNAWQFIRIAQVFLLRAITCGMSTGWLRYRQLFVKYDNTLRTSRRADRRLSCIPTYLASVRRLLDFPPNSAFSHSRTLHSHTQTRRRYSSNAAALISFLQRPPPFRRRFYGQILDFGDGLP